MKNEPKRFMLRHLRSPDPKKLASELNDSIFQTKSAKKN